MEHLSTGGVAVLVGGLSGSVMTASANDRTIFAGCVKERTDTAVTLDTSGGETITIDTTWLKPGDTGHAHGRLPDRRRR